MKTYEIEIHRPATLVRVSADSLTEAKRLAADVENADANNPKAFGHWRIIPTAAQIRKTKNLLRGI